MLIGIDMLGVQSSPGGERVSARLARQFVGALLAHDPDHRYVLYAHEGLPTDRIPSSSNAQQAMLAPVPGGSYRLRPTIQRLLDQNPDGLDWLILLDPFDELYGGLPPEAPLGGMKVASVVLDLSPGVADDRRIAPLRHHDAVLAFSEPTADLARRRLGSASWRVMTLGLACDESLAAPNLTERLSRSPSEEVERLGIEKPFIFASLTDRSSRANLPFLLEVYQRLPIEIRTSHQLAIAGPIDDPWSAFSYLHERGCAEGLVLVGEIDERALSTLYSRCSAFLGPWIEADSSFPAIEAMRCGAPIVTSRSELIGEAGLFVDSSNPDEIGARLAALLLDSDLDLELRQRSRERAARFSWGPVVKETLSTLGRGAEPLTLRPNLRIDPAHVARPRIAVFPDLPLEELAEKVPASWLGAYNVDLYLDPEHASLVDGLPAECGGFDARQFDRNDAILGYHAVVHRVSNAIELESKLAGLRTRPGLVFLLDEAFLDRVGADPIEDEEEIPAANRLRDLFLTSSKVVVRSDRHHRAIKTVMPEFAGQLIQLASEPPVNLVEQCAKELPRPQIRRRPGLQVGSRKPSATPHSRRSAPIVDEVPSHGRARVG